MTVWLCPWWWEPALLQTPDPRAGMLGWLLEALWGLLEALGLMASSLEEEQGNRWG